ncbi:hypothetical protein BGW80DRAFT_1458202 [Lactifluus volemus]|nr:hypothetical protein BGW80DRAFT_1458202 [Lactifluus volemus]
MATPTYSLHSDSNLTLPSLLPIISAFPVPMPLRNQRHRIRTTLSHLGWDYLTSHLPELTAGEPFARRLALLLDSNDSDIRDWAQKGYLKLGRTGRQLFDISLDGPEVNPPKEWSANKREERSETLKERLEREKERREEREEVEREMGWARLEDMFGEWLVDGHVDSVFRASPPFSLCFPFI